MSKIIIRNLSSLKDSDALDLVSRTINRMSDCMLFTYPNGDQYTVFKIDNKQSTTYQVQKG